jgi:hypothetical protein
MLAAPASRRAGTARRPRSQRATTWRQGRVEEHRGQHDERTHGERDRAQRREAAGTDVRPAAGADPPGDRECLHDREHRTGSTGGHPTSIVEIEHGEPRDAQLRCEEQRASDRESPDALVPDRRTAQRAPVGAVVLRPLTQDDATDRRAGEARSAHEHEAVLDSAHVRQHEGRQEAADRDRGLPDGKGEPSLPDREPVQDGATARRLHARPGHAREGDEARERPEAVRESRGDERAAAQRQPGHEHDALADAIGRNPPEEQAQERADERARQQQARLREREVVAVPERRRHHGDAEPDRGVRRLRERPRREDRPPVPRSAYSPNGLVGRVPVYVTTDFVSRYRSSVSSASSRPKPDCL